jgi:hypothetical protein
VVVSEKESVGSLRLVARRGEDDDDMLVVLACVCLAGLPITVVAGMRRLIGWTIVGSSAREEQECLSVSFRGTLFSFRIGECCLTVNSNYLGTPYYV